MEENAKLYTAGHCGMVGSVVERRLYWGGYLNVVVRKRAELDLLGSAPSCPLSDREPTALHLHLGRQGRRHSMIHGSHCGEATSARADDPK